MPTQDDPFAAPDLDRTIKPTPGGRTAAAASTAQAATVKRNPVLAMIPSWVAAAVCGLLLLIIYLAFGYSLNRISDPVFAQIYGIRQTTLPTRFTLPELGQSQCPASL